MIFKKPYAFLIKRFRLIHLVLILLTAFISYKTYRIMSVLNEYVVNNYTGQFYTGFHREYFTPILYLAIILILVGVIGICVLLSYKKKPIKVYLFSIIYFIILIVFLNITKELFITLERELVSAEISRAYRDLSIIVLIPQAVFIAFYFIRFLGFNIDGFNFKNDLKELEIADADNEEVELTFNNDGVALKRNFRRYIREFKYYVLENKFIISILGVLLMLFIIYIIPKKLPESVDERYKQGDVFNVSNLNISVIDSILSNIDYKGDIIDKDYYYLVIRTNVENASKNDEKLDYNVFRLKINNDYYYPIIDKSVHFIDYALNPANNVLKPNVSKVFAITYKIEKKNVKKNYLIKIGNGVGYANNKAKGKFSYVNVSPIIISDIHLELDTSIGQEINLANSNLKNSKIKFFNPIFKSRYMYNYEQCINDKCHTYNDTVGVSNNDKTLLIMNYEYELDESSEFYATSPTIRGFVERFVKIYYYTSDAENTIKVKNVTPNKLVGKVVFEVPNEVTNAAGAEVLVVIRNKEYRMKIK